MKQKIIAANWKMNTCLKTGLSLAKEINNYLVNANHQQLIILGVPFTHLKLIADNVDFKKIMIAAQNCSDKVSGAYTGEISASMIKSAGASCVIIGHSERRSIYKETDDIIKNKINHCLSNSMFPLFCCGETLEERKQNKQFEVVEKQIKAALFHLDRFNFERILIAYEPVWAIGTGEVASPEQAQEIHAHIRSLLKDKFDEKLANNTPILYGGSVKPDNAKSLFSKPDIDGGLIGGASLKAKDFIEIIKSAD